MSTLVAAAAAAQMLYTAKVASFGCSSRTEVARLQHLRSVQATFQVELIQQIFYGQCVSIAPGKRVLGTLEGHDPSLLLVDRQIEPPGYLAPRDDFAVAPAKPGK
jgi:hypothetical protein